LLFKPFEFLLFIVKKLQRVMDEEDTEDDNDNEEEDSDIPSDFEREMAVDSDSNDEDDDEEEENEDKLTKDIDQHKKELEELKERDPEFYKFLQKEDDGLLGFGESEDEEDQEAGEEYSDMEEPEEEEEEQRQEQIPVLKKAELNAWIESVKSNKDLRAFKKLLSAFKTAARMSEEDETITFTMKIEDPTGNKKKIELNHFFCAKRLQKSFPR
jgi:nucleolar complex protein 2